ncbi:hypothetical protein E4U21_005713 [Claviceps maximensis]|nr:hypothetical protein E4U21_005713 [Claviceps maximensis]
MASSTLLKDLTKAINSFLIDPFLPLPESLLSPLSAFLRRREEYDDTAIDQLQENLSSIFDKRIRDNDEAAGPWIAIIRRLLPGLPMSEKILPWFDAYKQILNEEQPNKCAVDETVAALMELAALIDEWQVPFSADSASKPVICGLFDLWINRFYPALLDGSPTSEYNERLVRISLSNLGRKRPKELLATVDDYLVHKTHRKSALRFLCDFIQGQPPHLHQILDTPLFSNLLICLQRDTSTTIVSAALTTLIMLLPHMPSSLVPHLPALLNIYGRLLFWDREHSRLTVAPDSENGSGGAVTGSGWEVATFETEVDDQIIAHLPRYFTILYGLYPLNFMDYIRKPQRYMRHANASHLNDLEVQPTEMRHRSERFKHNHLLHANFYSLTIESEKTDVSRWIKSEAAEVVAECMSLCLEADMHTFADPSTAVPEPGGGGGGANSTDTNADNDMTNDGSKADVAILGGLSGSKHDSWRYSHVTASDSMSRNHSPAAMMRRSSQSSIPSHQEFGDGRPRPPGTYSPTLTLSSSYTQLQDLIQSNKVIKSGLHQSLADESTPSLAMSHHEFVAERATILPSENMAPPPPPPPPALPPHLHPLPHASSSPLPASTSESSTQVAHLQKLILLLQNDLSFERYLKQQHMAHIGEIRRKQMSEAATEAETQNLIIMNRNLKSRFEDAKKSEMRAKKESERSRDIAKKWEAKLTHKLKTLRDKSEEAHADSETLQKELDESLSDCDKLRKLLYAAEVKELDFRQTMKSLEMDGTQVETLKLEVERLTRSERDHQAKELERAQAIKSAREAGNQAEVLRMKLTALQNDAQRTQKLFQAQIKALQAQLSEAHEERERPGWNSDIAIETALAASRAKQAELQTQYSLLMRKYTALQSSLLDMQSEHEYEQQREHRERQSSFRTATLAQQQQQQQQLVDDPDYLSFCTSPMVIKSRPHRALSNAEATGHNMTSPVDSSEAMTSAGDATLSASAGHSHPETPAAMPTSRMSPDQRHFAAFQRLRRESRDKTSKEDGSGSGGGGGGGGGGTGSGKSKKEKKASGLRGIRGFV